MYDRCTCVRRQRAGVRVRGLDGKDRMANQKVHAQRYMHACEQRTYDPRANSSGRRVCMIGALVSAHHKADECQHRDHSAIRAGDRSQ